MISSENTNTIEYIETTDVAAILNQHDVKIIDVRGEYEYQDGHIPNAINIPSDKWENIQMIDELALEHGRNGTSTVIFHCMYSQQRGPSCARRYAARKVELIANKTIESLPDM